MHHAPSDDRFLDRIHKIKLYAFEVALVLIFLWKLWQFVRFEIGF